MLVPHVYPDDVLTSIHTLQNKTGSLSEVPTFMIKSTSAHLSASIVTIFNQLITNGQYPQVLKHATVIPVYKKGSKIPYKITD